jgi:hypothetical protein
LSHVYLSPEHAGETGATLAGWYADDVEAIVVDSSSDGVACGRYAEGPMISVA